jgi:predicted O-methyltransferase YrrM
MNLAEQYERLCRDTSSDIWQHLPTFVETVGSLDAHTVIELGVRAGISTIAWLHALENRGRLWSVDGAPPCEDTDGTDLLGPYLNKDRNQSILDHWTFIKGWDNEPTVRMELPSSADIIFVDTNHTYEMTMDELENYWPRVRPGGQMLFHDTNIETTGNATTPQPLYPVRTAIEEYCSEHSLNASFVDYSCGLGSVYI